jgi:myosin heavy subunit
MRNGYDSVLGIVQKTLQRSKPNPMAIVKVKGITESRLNDKLEELEKMVADSIGKLKAEVNDSAAAVASETQRTKEAIEKAIENLKANIVLLNTKLRESEDTIRSKEAASQKTEETLTARIAALEANLRDTEEMVRGKDATIRRLEQNSAARIQDLENQVKTKDELLVGRSTEVSDLKTQLEALKNGIKEMSSFFNQSEILATVEGQNNSAVIRKRESKTGQENPAATRFTGPTATAEVTDAALVAMPPNFFNHMTHELSEFSGPMASVIIHDHVVSLGESTGKFPKARVPELLEIISREIPDENGIKSFRERLGKLYREDQDR